MWTLSSKLTLFGSWNSFLLRNIGEKWIQNWPMKIPQIVWLFKYTVTDWPNQEWIPISYTEPFKYNTTILPACFVDPHGIEKAFEKFI